MNRDLYSKKTLCVFDNIGSFFVDKYYNFHYLFSRDLSKNNAMTSITDVYRSTVINYINGIKNRPDLYLTVIKDLHEYYQKSIGCVIICSDFEDRIVSQFIPEEYYRDFTSTHKDNALKDIIVNIVTELTKEVLSKKTFRKIIDDHMNIANVELLQDRVVDICITQRENYISKFIKKVAYGDTSRNIDRSVFNNLRKIYIEEKKKRIDIEDNYNRCYKLLNFFITKSESLEKEIKNIKQANAPEQYEIIPRGKPKVVQKSISQVPQVPQVEASQVPQVEASQVPQVEVSQVPQVEAPQVSQVPQVEAPQVPQVEDKPAPQYSINNDSDNHLFKMKDIESNESSESGSESEDPDTLFEKQRQNLRINFQNRINGKKNSDHNEEEKQGSEDYGSLDDDLGFDLF